MNRRVFLKTSLAVCSGLTLAPLARNAGRRPGAAPGKAQLELLVCDGPPRERGRIHGESLRARIGELVALWKESISRNYGVNPDRFIAEFMGDTRFGAAAQAFAPGLFEEVLGIAEGAGIDPTVIQAFQCIDEEWWYGRNRLFGIGPVRRRPLRAAAAPDAPEKCSVIAAFGQEGLPAVLGQNLDIMDYYDGYQVLLHIRHHDADLEAFSLTSPGYIGMNGLNSHGVGVCVNALLQLDQRVDGLPVAYVVRGILERESFAEAVRFARSIDHASGQAYTIGSPEEIATFECSAYKKPQVTPPVHPTRLGHTNHPLVSDDQAIFRQLMAKLGHLEAAGGAGPSDSEVRLASLERRLADLSRPFTVESAQAALGSHDDPSAPVCRHGPGAFTFGCTIMELSDRPVLHVAPGPACRTEFRTFSF